VFQRAPAIRRASRGSGEKLRSGQVAGHYYVLLLGLRTFDTAGLMARIGQGLSYNALERFGRNAGISREEVCDLIQIPPRTLARRKEEGLRLEGLDV